MPYHSYIFFDADPNIRTFQPSRLRTAKREFAMLVTDSANTKVNAYATLGFKAGTRFMLHINARSPDITQSLVRDVLRSKLGAYLSISHTLFGITRPSQYNPSRSPESFAMEKPHRYLVVYPFTKTDEWYALSYQKRRKMMAEHVVVGKKYSANISQLLLHAFGVDDYEFIVSYGMDSLEKFQDVVMELRGTSARRYTKSDTPVFTCIHMALSDALEMI